MNRNSFIIAAFNVALAFFCIARASAQPWLAGTNGSIYNPNSGSANHVGIGTSNPTATIEIANTPNHTFHAGVIGNRTNTNVQILSSAAPADGKTKIAYKYNHHLLEMPKKL
ncbi:MAG TPA: hypothetical protein VL727_23315 [Puia sp.]|jgi:hypothetical protein|nr:hypothetical protein [Puia sp.]